MKILYAIQGTGNGHISRGIEIIPHLKKHGDVDILISGAEWELNFPFKVKYRLGGMSFVFGKNGGVDLFNTYLKLNSFRFMREIKSVPVEEYDLVISDFEPISCWATHLKKIPCIGLSNQVATLHRDAPVPKNSDRLGKLVLEHYAPVTKKYGYHFKALDENIFTPVIRSEIRNCNIKDKGHITVYLPSYDDERIIKNLKNFKQVDWQVFSKHNKKKFKEKNIYIEPISNAAFVKSMSESSGVLCNAGFGVTSETLFLNKKLCIIPMRTQYEQHCNAAMLKSMGVTVVKKLKSKHLNKIENWIEKGKSVEVDYPDNAASIVKKIIVENYKVSYSPFDASSELYQ
ncbi:MAG: glycosyltransferase family protein [Bacteroidia bacterium]